MRLVTENIQKASDHARDRELVVHRPASDGIGSQIVSKGWHYST
jgi:hypothetical protein